MDEVVAMRETTLTWTAVASSVALHVGVLGAAWWWAGRGVGWWDADDGWSVERRDEVAMRESEAAVPEATRAEPLPEIERLGERGGAGDALSTVEMTEEMEGPMEGPLQAWQRRPAGMAMEGEMRGDAVRDGLLSGSERRAQLGPAGRLVREAMREVKQSARRGASVEVESTPEGELATGSLSRSNEIETRRETDGEASADASGAQAGGGAMVEVAQTGEMSREAAGSSGGSASEVGGTDDAEESGASDSEVDPFATRHGVEFRPGGMEARGGREIKARRPRVDLAFLADATRLGRPIGMTFRVSIDAGGSVDRVEVVRSSGSGHIDDAVRLAIYESRFGPPAPAEFLFGVSLR